MPFEIFLSLYQAYLFGADFLENYRLSRHGFSIKTFLL